MTRPFAALAVLLAAAAAGCGQPNQPSQEFNDEQEDVAEVVEELQRAAQEDEATTICTEILSTELSRRLGDDCTKTVQTAFDDADVFEIGADRVDIRGDRATVRIDAGSDGAQEQEELVMVNERQGGWRVAEFRGPVQ